MTTIAITSAECGLVSVPVQEKRSRSGSWRWRRIANEVIDTQGGQCLICGTRVDLTCHHIRPRRDGGKDTRENLIALCASDHTTLHLIERDLAFLSRLLIAVMVVFGPSEAVCRFLRLVFPLLVRRGTGFHPATLRMRPLRAVAPAAALIACLFITAGATFAQALPSPDTIKLVQEREAHERAVAARIVYQVAKQPQKVTEPEAPRPHLSAAETRELMEALNRYFRENAGRVPVFWIPEGRP